MGRPKAIPNEPTDTHISLTSPTRDLLREFCWAAGRVTYSEGIRILIDQVRRSNESIQDTGERISRKTQKEAQA